MKEQDLKEIENYNWTSIAETTIQDAITFIECADSACSCSIIKSCNNCSSRKKREDLIQRLYELSNSMENSNREKE